MHSNNNKEIKLLKELNEIIPPSAYGANATMFTIALEGWRRGLKLRFFTKIIKNQIKIRYALSSEQKEIIFQLSLAEIVPKESRKTTRSKESTKEVLIEKKIPTPKGGSFNEKDGTADILRFAESLEYPLIIKPTNGSLGIGVIVGIQNEKMLKDALEELREKKGYKDIIMEEEVTGEDTRLFVVGNEVICAFKRVPANVIGDGKKTIKQLINDKNVARKNNPHMNGSKLPVDSEVIDFLAVQNLTLDSIINESQKVILSSSTIASKGAEIVEVTEELTPESRKIAIEAAHALPGLTVCGVDIMIDREKGTNYVLELNSRPNISGSLFPWTGTPKNIPKAIVDFYFPESVSNIVDRVSNSLYFDFDKISEILKSGVVKEVIIPTAPEKEIARKKIVVFGKVQGVGFREFVKRKATGLQVNGFVRNLKDGNVQIVVAGDNSKVNNFIEIIESKKTKKINVSKVEIHNWNKPLKIGFEIKNTVNNNTVNLKTNLNLEKKKNSDLIKQLKDTERKLKSIEMSKSWKYTLPARKLLKSIKRD